MRVLQINSVCGIRSTGRICTDMAEVLQRQGHECKIAYGRETVPEKYQSFAVRIGTDFGVKLDGIKTRLLDNAGFNSAQATKRFLSWVKEYDPDIIHLHNLHGYYIHVGLLFDFLKEFGKPVIWTLHDCWSFTGHCPHFAAQGCEKWREMCGSCPLQDEYPASLLLDNSARNYRRKRERFCGLENLQIVTVSDWLGKRVAESFLGGYPVTTIQNGIDLSVFRPTESNIAEKYGLQGKRIVLGVASAWSKHKGLEDFFRLAQMLDDDYQVVLVGLTMQQMEQLPGNVVGIRRTDSIQELAQLYTAAYVHVSMSREETMGLTIIEANACGTPVVVFDSTALPEIVTPDTGVVLKECTPEAVAKAILETDFSKEKYAQSCIAHAGQFEKNQMYSKYIELYRSIAL